MLKRIGLNFGLLCKFYYTVLLMSKLKQSHFIGFIGPIGSGKSTACDFFKQKGYQIISLSDIIRSYVKEHNLSDDRDTLTHYSNLLKEKNGIAYFAEQSYSHVVNNHYTDVVFDSIRHPDEASFLKEKGVFLVGIQANQQERYDRISKRKHGTDFVDLSTFVHQDTNELKGTNKGQDIEACYQFCDLVITNDRSLDHFISELNTILVSLVS